MKIILWIGNEPNQKAFANKLHHQLPISGIITESRISKRRWTLKLFFEKAVEKIFFPSIGKAWWKMLLRYNDRYPNYPEVPSLDVENINSDEAFDFTSKLAPDLILVSGTRLIKEKMLSIHPKIGILNLHTGLSPYVKGGPNCTNWCISNKEFQFIGNTIMWIDKGIDTGNILTTEFTPINGFEDLLSVHEKVMDHAHQLYIQAVQYLNEGKKQSVVQSSICQGRTFYTKEWTLRQKIKLIRNFKKLKPFIQSGKMLSEQKKIKTISLEEF